MSCIFPVMSPMFFFPRNIDSAVDIFKSARRERYWPVFFPERYSASWIFTRRELEAASGCYGMGGGEGGGGGGGYSVHNGGVSDCTVVHNVGKGTGSGCTPGGGERDGRARTRRGDGPLNSKARYGWSRRYAPSQLTRTRAPSPRPSRAATALARARALSSCSKAASMVALSRTVSPCPSGSW